MKSIAFASLALAGLASLVPAPAAARNTIHLNSKDSYCLILPNSRMTIGDSEDGGNDKTDSFCSDPHYDKGQKQFPVDAWWGGRPYFAYGHGYGDYVQLTGGFNAYKVPTLIPDDNGGGGQYDSNGGDTGHGNPLNSHCKGYSSYVSIIEVDRENSKACVRCCQDNRDCPVIHDSAYG